MLEALRLEAPGARVIWVSSCEVYGTPAERPIADVDVRVMPRHIDAIADVARANKWTVLEHVSMYYNVVLEVSGVLIDVDVTVRAPSGSARDR